MDGMTNAMANCLSTTAWGMRHFGGIVTNRQLRKSVMRRCVQAGLCRCVGLVAVCDGDGFTIRPERYRLGYVLTKRGEAALRELESASK